MGIIDKILKIHRLQFDLDESAFDSLNALVTRTKAENRAAVIRDALRLYGYLLDRVSEGWSLRIVRNEAGREIVLSWEDVLERE